MNVLTWLLIAAFIAVAGVAVYRTGISAGRSEAENDPELHATWMLSEDARKARELYDNDRSYPARGDAGPPARVFRANVKGRERKT